MAQQPENNDEGKEPKTKKNNEENPKTKKNNEENPKTKKPWWKTTLKWLGITAVAGGTFYGGYKVGYNKGRKSTTIQ